MSKHFSFGREATLGQAVTPDKGLAIRPGEGLKTALDLKGLEAMDGGISLYSEYTKGLATHEGEIELDLDSITSGYLFNSLCGNVTTNALSGINGAYKHKFLPTGNKVSLTVEQYNDNFPCRYAGVIVNSAKLAITEGESLIGTFNLFALKAITENITAATTSFEAGHVFSHIDVVDGLVIDGLAMPLTSSFEVEIIANKKPQYALGDNNPQLYAGSKFEVKGKFVIYLSNSSDVSFYETYLNKAAKSIKISLKGDLIGASETKESLTLALPKAYFSALINPITNEAARLEVEFIATIDQATQTLFELELINKKADYTI